MHFLKFHRSSFLFCLMTLLSISASLTLAADDPVKDEVSGDATSDLIAGLTEQQAFRAGDLIRQLGLSADGKFAVLHTGFLPTSGVNVGALRVWDLETRKLVKELKPFTLPFGPTLLTYPNAKLYRWRGLEATDVVNGKHEMMAAEPWQTASVPLAVTSKGDWAVFRHEQRGRSAVSNFIIFTSGRTAGDNVYRRLPPYWFPEAAAISTSDGHVCIVGSWRRDAKSRYSGFVHVLDATFKDRQKQLEGTGHIIRDDDFEFRLSVVQYSPDETRLFVAGGRTGFADAGEGVLVLYDTATHVERCRKPTQSAVTSMRCSPDGECIAIGSADGSLSMWRIVDWKLVRVVTVDAAHEGSISGLAWSADATRIITGGYDGFVRTWAINGCERVKR